MSPATTMQRGLLVAICCSAACWGLLALTRPVVSIGSADLPGFKTIEQAVDKRIGEKLVEKTRGEVDKRYAREKAAYEGKLDAAAADLSPVDAIAQSEKLADGYKRAFAATALAAAETTFLKGAYQKTLQDIQSKLALVTKVQKRVNQAQKTINRYNQLYVKAKFLMGR